MVLILVKFVVGLMVMEDVVEWVAIGGGDEGVGGCG